MNILMRWSHLGDDVVRTDDEGVLVYWRRDSNLFTHSMIFLAAHSEWEYQDHEDLWPIRI